MELYHDKDRRPAATAGGDRFPVRGRAVAAHRIEYENQTGSLGVLPAASGIAQPCVITPVVAVKLAAFFDLGGD